MPDDLGLAASAVGDTLGGRAEIPLWPEGPPRGLAGVGPEAAYRNAVPGPRMTTMLRNVSRPTLTPFRPDPARANGVGVIVCPGGGWQILAWEHEGVEVCEWLAARGYAAFLLKYRVSATPDDHEVFMARAAESNAALSRPLAAAETPRSIEAIVRVPRLLEGMAAAAEDGRRALALVRDMAADYGVDPAKVGMIGFSAGAFLAADVAMDPGGPPLAFVAPIYGGETRGRPVPADAPPLFTAVAQDDRLLVSVVRGMVDDWFAADRPVESHLFSKGAHGFGMARQGLAVDAWIDLFAAWLADQGFA